MKLNEFNEQLKSMYLKFGCSSESLDIDLAQFDILTRIYPNDAFYVIDCKRAIIYKLSDNINLLDVDKKERIMDFKPLMSLVHDKQFDKFCAFTERCVGMGSRQFFLTPFKDEVKSIYKTSRGHTVLKTVSVIAVDKNGNPDYTLGRLTDITDVTELAGMSYKFFGPSQKKMYSFFNGLEKFDKILGERELEILNYVGKGYSSKSISDVLFISEHTVRTHRKNIVKKLDAHGSIDAYNKAKDMGLM